MLSWPFNDANANDADRADPADTAPAGWHYLPVEIFVSQT